ncbi:hypothetical protein [Paenibacillus contaminans]|uniref:Uncharacterized protein n=1 Tax=Paenibacillus contaminans TaxID=450362 RepID=A0A329LP31_9BACL|nr:hypothetical protein [Paenibacillus contaminans]RAV08473.1 hypothetical protein DQG23_41070 [Paenibacillus contaminans]
MKRTQAVVLLFFVLIAGCKAETGGELSLKAAAPNGAEQALIVQASGEREEEGSKRAFQTPAIDENSAYRSVMETIERIAVRAQEARNDAKEQTSALAGLDRALEASGSWISVELKRNIRFNAADAYAAIGEYDEAERTVETIDDAFYKASAWAKIAERYAEDGKNGQAGDLLLRCVDILKTIDHAADRISLVRIMTSAFFKAGDVEGGLRLADMIKKEPLLQSSEYYWPYYVSIYERAAVHAERFGETKLADRIFGKLVELTNSLPDGFVLYDKESYLAGPTEDGGGVIGSFASIGAYERCRELIGLLESELVIVKAWKDVAKAAYLQGDTKEASQAIGEAERKLGRMKDSDSYKIAKRFVDEYRSMTNPS